MANYYVAKTGSDEDSGSLNLPFLTIVEGLQQVKNGDCLYVFGGVYEEDLTFTDTDITNQPASVWDDLPRVVAYPGESVTLVGSTTKTLAYFSLCGVDAVQDPANYAGVTLVDITSQRSISEPRVHALAFVVGGVGYVTDVPADLTRPVVTISSPVDGDVVSGTTQVVASCTDAVGIECMWIQVDGKTTLSEYPADACELAWDTTLYLNDTHVLTALAKDICGNVGISEPLTVVVVGNVPPLEVTAFSPSITVTSPSGTDLWRAGMVVDITWTSLGIEGALDMFFIRDGVSHQIFFNVANNSTISWTVIGNRAPRCKIRINSINDSRVYGVSEEFSIV